MVPTIAISAWVPSPSQLIAWPVPLFLGVGKLNTAGRGGGFPLNKKESPLNSCQVFSMNLF